MESADCILRDGVNFPHSALRFMKQRSTLLLTGIILLLTAFVADAQNAPRSDNEYFKIELGYSSMFLAKDQGATNPIFLADGDTVEKVAGSSFYGAQSGLSVRANFELGPRKKIIIPFGIDYTFFSGIQRLPSKTSSQHGYVSLNMFSIVGGAQYRVLDLPLANAFMYAGVEARGSIVPGASFRYETQDSAVGSPLRVQIDTIIKPTVFRLGGAFRFGVQGEISEPLFVNINLAYGINNLVGRDLRTTLDRRAELLTPTRINESVESYSKFLQFCIWFQYRL